jgi:hypothetical protein
MDYNLLAGCTHQTDDLVHLPYHKDIAIAVNQTKNSFHLRINFLQRSSYLSKSILIQFNPLFIYVLNSTASGQLRIIWNTKQQQQQ